MIVAIDGPAGAGKSTVSRILAETLRFQLIDTGALYRGVALMALRRGIPPESHEALATLALSLPFRFVRVEGANRLYVGDEDVEAAIRTPETTAMSSRVSAVPEVRAAMLGLQRRMGESADSVMEGRDIGTVVFPAAEVKVYLNAKADARAARRVKDYAGGGTEAELEAVRAAIIERDERDSTRAVAPLRQAEDAVGIDTTELTIDEVVERILGLVRAVRSRA